MSRKKRLLLTVVGPTAIGKTRLAIALAQHFGAEIISCDSRQFFREMRIGTAVPTAEEQTLIKHHFIQHKSIFEPYSVGDFERDTLTLLHNLFETHEVVVMVGGSGLYVKAVIDGLDDFPTVDEHIRETLNAAYQSEGIEVLQTQLKELDPQHYAKVDTQNPHRMIRALEVCIATGKPYSSFLQQKNVCRDFETLQIGLTADKEIVYQRINDRVEQMLAEGLLIETQQLLPYKQLNALQTVGYRELFDFWEGKHSLLFAIEEIKKNTRRFAKRQYTWFNRDERIQWFDYQTPIEEIIKKTIYNGENI